MAKVPKKTQGPTIEGGGGARGGGRINAGGRITRIPSINEIKSQNRAAGSYKMTPVPKDPKAVAAGKAAQQTIQNKGAAKAIPGAVALGYGVRGEVDKVKISTPKPKTTPSPKPGPKPTPKSKKK